MTPGAAAEAADRRLQNARKGIILLHDPKAQTAAMLPAFLRYLRDNRYRVVHVGPRPAPKADRPHVRSKPKDVNNSNN